jgi:hypothetical protein
LAVIRITTTAGATFRVYENPTQTQFDNFKRHELRGLTDGTTLWLWDAYVGEHFEVAEKLGVQVRRNPLYRNFTLNLLDERLEDTQTYDYRHDKLPPIYRRLDRLLRRTRLK